jgi:hypothetical protein
MRYCLTPAACGGDDRIEELDAEIERLRASLMRYVQQCNECEQTGEPCREPARCGCWLEAQAWHTQGDAP